MILYYSDKYAFDVMGTKRSLYDHLVMSNLPVQRIELKEVGNIQEHIKWHDATHVFLASSDLRLPVPLKDISIPVIGFGFSDPYGFSESRLLSYNLYVTNHYLTFLKLKEKHFPCHYFPTACDPRFHCPSQMIKKYDVSMIGMGNHMRFLDPRMRISYVDSLRRDHVDVHVFGTLWPNHSKNHPPVSGSEFLRAVNSTRLCIDIQDQSSPLAHRMMEYGACGVPVITRDRPEVSQVFEVGTEILTYIDFDDLQDQILELLKHPDLLEDYGLNIRRACLNKHTMASRVCSLLEFLGIDLSEE